MEYVGGMNVDLCNFDTIVTNLIEVMPTLNANWMGKNNQRFFYY